jgi:hypothetical protein
MRRRETNVWPAFADLMTALSVVGMGLAFFALAESRRKDVDQQTLTDCETLIKDAAVIEADAAAAAKAVAAKYAEREAELRRCVEATAMKDAVDLAENAMREVATALGQTQGGVNSISNSNSSFKIDNASFSAVNCAEFLP